MIHVPSRQASLFVWGTIGLLLTAATTPVIADTEWSFGGHVKLQSAYTLYPVNSAFRDVLGSASLDNDVETRIKIRARNEPWDFRLDYQFIGIYADTLQLAKDFPDSPLPIDRVINDNRRWWDLTTSFGEGDKTEFINRLDRLSVGYTGEKTVWRFGRQAISWGNGMIFTPMDIFNPFDPVAVDTEYKTGDDMLYGQYLLDSGNDVQGVAIVRRNPYTGEVEANQSSLATKFHGFVGMNEFDLLAAQHYGDQVLGVGGTIGIGGSIWRGDLTWTDTDTENVFSAATSLSYSWNWGGRNISGLIEYYYNGFGQKDGAYSVDDLLHNPNLLERIERGELFTLARHYIGTSATVEMTPLLNLTPTVLVNLTDPSALAQLVINYNWMQNVAVIGAVNLPVGPDGSEYGGTKAPLPDRYYSTGLSFLAQLAWYF